MSHRDTVINGNGIEFGRKTTELFNLRLHLLTDFMQMCMSWNKLGKRIHDGNNRLSNHFLLHAIGHPKGASPCHASALCTERTA